MKTFTRLLVLLMALAMLVTFSACGGNDGNTNASNSETPKSDSTKSGAEAQIEADKELLKSEGYTVSVLTSDVDRFEGMLDAESGSLVAYLNAYTSAGSQVIAYYFKTEEQAAKCYESKESAYKLVGYSLVYGDEENILN